ITLQGLDIFDANVYMPGMTMIGSGPGAVSGNIVSIDNSPFDPKEKLIFLYSNDSIVAYDHTDQLGYFEFNALPLNTYTLKAEIAGHYSSLAQINLTENQALVSDIQIEISSSGVFGLEDLPVTNISDLRLYPNPVENAINIRIKATVSESCILKIISSTGAVVTELTVTLQAGDNKINLDAGNLKSGLYLLTCLSENDSKPGTLRFIKK
ncbi:MAG: T9SS type A sorting domain-containing protein, partial [Lentimicrobium sp.]|nr:T9SS type A sorting domain-containing protein [Lentimicrobium sp.]